MKDASLCFYQCDFVLRAPQGFLYLGCGKDFNFVMSDRTVRSFILLCRNSTMLAFLGARFIKEFLRLRPKINFANYFLICIIF
jgi:hypothetical protein